MFWEIAFPVAGVKKVQLQGGVVKKISGVASEAALPKWIRGVTVDEYDSVENVAKIRRAGLTPAQVILVTIIRKTFFQRGHGRKEEALLRGLGKIASRNTATKILNQMEGEGLLSSFRGDEGTVYVPNRGETARMQRLIDELRVSEDRLWKLVS